MEPRSWTDLSSNLTHLGDVRLAEHLDALLEPGKAAPHLTMACLHELTHHWCFHSQVGLAIVGLQYRMTCVALTGDQEQADQYLFTAAAFHTVTTALRPLLEGMALFAEFDAASIDSPIASKPMLAGISLFSGKASHALFMTDSGDFVQVSDGGMQNRLISMPMNAHLHGLRVDEQGIKRKVNVLASRLEQDEGGYLLGYLAVKSLWRSMRRRCQRLYTETDLALALLRGFFFEDMELVALLLTPPTPDDSTTIEQAGVDCVNRIIDHLNDRIQLLGRLADSDVEAFEALLLQQVPMTSPQWADPLHISAPTWNAGAQARQELLDELHTETSDAQSTPENRLSDGLREVFARMLDRRHIVRLGTARATVSVSRFGRFTARIGGGKPVRGRALRGRRARSTLGSAAGSVELIFSALSQGLYRAAAVYGPTSIIGVFAPSLSRHQTHELEHKLLLSQPFPGDLYLQLLPAMEAVNRDYFDQTWQGFVLDGIHEQLPDIVRGLYLDCGLNTVPDEQLTHVIHTLDTGGIYALLDYDRDLLEALIILGATRPFMPYRAGLVLELSKHRFPDPEAIVDRLVTITEQTGVLLLTADENQVLVHI